MLIKVSFKLPVTTYPKIGGKFIPDGTKYFTFIGFGGCRFGKRLLFFRCR